MKSQLLEMTRHLLQKYYLCEREILQGFLHPQMQWIEENKQILWKEQKTKDKIMGWNLTQYCASIWFSYGNFDFVMGRFKLYKMEESKKKSLISCNISSLFMAVWIRESHREKLLYMNITKRGESAQLIPYLRRILLKSINGEYQFICLQEVICIEAFGKHMDVYCVDRMFTMVGKIANMENQYGTVLWRVHRSYLINPSYIQYIKRYEITLSNGMKIPVPVAKYSILKKRLQNYREEF